jgi:hypothetical protein
MAQIGGQNADIHICLAARGGNRLALHSGGNLLRSAAENVQIANVEAMTYICDVPFHVLA